MERLCIVREFSIEYLLRFLFIVGKLLKGDILPAALTPATVDLSNAVSLSLSILIAIVDSNFIQATQYLSLTHLNVH